ncbi:MAG: cellulase family glycosylhydrolase [Planctomycetes bacterium]|nr:cellulase family glycosylhydrolase [Planctomycetota bacterium]
MKNRTSALLISLLIISNVFGYYTTKGQDVIDKVTGETVILQGFGIGCWLLPEGYMWGIRKIDRPRQFEKAIEDLIGAEDAKNFWQLYHDNFLIEDDVKAMKLMGVNSIRIALLASMLQPRQGQPDKPPYKYSEEGFKYLDRVVDWCTKYKVGLIWDMHGAPGGQNAANISDSDGVARLWTEKEKYWPRCIELWYKIAERYKDKDCIVGYDLLNEPLLKRYEGVDVALLREFYVELTKKIRTVDTDGIIFIEGDDWAQDFTILEPLDWDEHLVVAFHSYPPTSNQQGMQRWDDLRIKYNVPLWHGETGEQRAPYRINKMSTEFLNSVNVGWNWWTHKKFNRSTQPWNCPRTEGFQKILDYWKGKAPKPTKIQAKEWFFDQASRLHSDYCEFVPEMVDSLVPLKAEKYLAVRKPLRPRILEQPQDVQLQVCDSASLIVRVSGHPLNFIWKKNGKEIPNQNNARLRIEKPSLKDNGSKYSVIVFNEKGSVTSKDVTLTVKKYSGPVIKKTAHAPKIDGVADDVWNQTNALTLDNRILGGKNSKQDLSANFKILWDEKFLYLLVEVTDDIKFHRGEPTFQNDSVEFYVDYDNSKSGYYDDDDYQFRYEWNWKKISTRRGKKLEDIIAAQTDHDKGYVMELAVPWEELGGEAPAGKYIGIDVHVNDNDNKKAREAKIAWKAKSDSSHSNPMSFGTMKLTEN